MLRAELKPSTFSKWVVNKQVAITSTINFPLPLITDLVKHVDCKPPDKFPLLISLSEQDTQEMIYFPSSKDYLVFIDEEDKKKICDQWEQRDLVNCSVIKKCCFLRGIEDLYQRFTGRYLSYQEGMDHSNAMQIRSTMFGDDCIGIISNSAQQYTIYIKEKFCWDTDIYGTMAWNQGRHSVTLSTVDRPIPVRRSSTSSEESFRPSLVHTDDKSAGCLSDVSVLDEVKRINLRRKFKVDCTCAVEDHVLQWMNQNDYILHEGHHIMHPEVLIFYKVASRHGTLMEAAVDWYSRHHCDNRPILKPTPEMESHVRSLPHEVLQLLYQLSGCFDDYKQLSDVTCRLCDDVNSHASKWCVRFPSLEERWSQLGNACRGCGEADCTIGDNWHKAHIAEGCEQCCDNYDTFCHTDWLCDSSHNWLRFADVFLGMCCLAQATKTWSLNDMQKVISFSGSTPHIRPGERVANHI